MILAGSLLNKAVAASYDFESQPTTSGGALSSLSLTDSGLTITITRGRGVHFDIRDLSGLSGPPSFGSRTLDPFQPGDFAPGNQFIGDFSSALTSFSIQFGDYDADDDTFVLTAWSGAGGTGTIIDTMSIFWPAGNTFPDDVGTGTVSGAGIMSVTWTGLGAFNNSLFYDNLVASTAAVPDGGTTAMLLGLSISSLLLFQRIARSRQHSRLRSAHQQTSRL
jgi:hypothetical protein